MARDRQHHVGVDDFFWIYASARPQALSNSNIESAFRATGIVPFNPEEVLNKLGAINVPLPPPSLSSSLTNSVSNTPKTVRQIEKQQRAVKHRQYELQRRSISPTMKAIRKMAKSAKLALQAAVIMTKELKRAQATNAKVVKKRNIKVKYITQRESLIIKEAIELSHKPSAPLEVAQNGSGNATPKASSQAPRHCSGCGLTGHTVRTCQALKKP